MVDLHLHSNFSDGKDSVEQLFKKAYDKKLHTISIVDHDTVDQLKFLATSRGKKLTKEYGIRVIPGVEVSSIIDGVRVHLLVYNFDYHDKNIVKLCKIGVNLRKIKLEKRLEYLASLGIDLNDEHLKYLHSLKTVGKRQISNCMIEEGYVSSIEEACKNILNKYRDEDYRTEAKDVIELSHKAGALVGLAHPFEIIDREHRDEKCLIETITKLKGLGLDALEVYYGDYDKIRQAYLQKLADKSKLLTSGGSDTHGYNDSPRAVGKLRIDDKPVADNKLTILDEF